MLIILLILAIVFIVISTTRFNLHPFLALIIAAIGYGLSAGVPLDSIIASVNNGFGSTVSSIGIVIVVGCIIGTFLEESGGAYVMARSALKVVGQKHVPLAMLLLGYIISIPVFADSGFVILTPLNRALSKKAGITLASTACALGLGLTITHCLIPPTPGPIAAAGILEADLGLVILTGIASSILPLLVAWLFVTRWATRFQIDPEPNATEADIERKIAQAPSAFKSFLPIMVPLILIVLRSVSTFPSAPFGNGSFARIIGFVGEPVVALLIGMVLSFTLPGKFERAMLSATGWVGKALSSAAIIIMITSAGGSFGMILRDSGIANVLGEVISRFHLGIWLPFLITAALKTAQGSSTVAIITSASIVAPLMGVMGFDAPLEKAVLVTALCAGAMVVSHVNDSFFWVETQMSGMSIKTGYKLHTLGTFLCGMSAMLTMCLMHAVFC